MYILCPCCGRFVCTKYFDIYPSCDFCGYEFGELK